MQRVILFRNFSHTRAAAFLYVEQKAGPIETLMLLEFVVRTGTDWKRSEKVLQGVTYGARMNIRPEIPHTTLSLTTKNSGSRPFFVHGDCQERKTLIVLQSNVEPWAMFFNQTEFKQQRFHFVTNFYPFHFLRCSHHVGRSWMKCLRVGKITRNPGSQIECFPYVDDSPAGIAKLIGTRRIRNYS